VPLARGGSSVG